MGEVYRARDTRLGRDVAIKVLPDLFVRDQTRLARFAREAQLLAALNHPNIAGIHGLEEADGITALALELVEGETLAERIARGPIPVGEAIPIALQIAEALEGAHEKGIIHRDLKPGNVKFAADGRVKVLDFGLAKATHENQGPSDLTCSPTLSMKATQAGVILGTAAYMSPEQARGQEVDRRTDIWSFGCVLFEMLTGRGLFHGPTASDCIAGILEREPDWESLPEATPRAVRRLLRRCLSKEIRGRLHDICDARLELLDVATGRDDETAGRRSPSRAVVWGSLTGALLGLFLGVLVTAALVSGPHRPGSSTGAPARRLSISLPVEAPCVPDPATSSLDLSKDGRVLVYIGPESGIEPAGGLGGDNPRAFIGFRTQLFVREMDSFSVRPVEGTRGAHSPFLSPDGAWVGYVDSHDNKIKKIRLNGGIPVTVSEEARGMDFRGFDWAEDGRIYFGGATGGLEAVPADGGEIETLSVVDHARDEKTHRFPHVLPGGRGVLFTLASAHISSYDDASVALLDLRTGEYRTLIKGGTDPAYVASGHILYARNGGLEAAAFDLDSLQVSGSPFQVAGQVVTSDGWGSGQYSVSEAGALAYIPGGPDLFQAQVYWLDLDGSLETIPLPARPYGTAAISPDGKHLALSILGANASVWTYDIERRPMTRLTSTWDNTGPVWSHNGTHLTFYSNRIDRPGIWQLAVGGGAEPMPLFTEKHPSPQAPNSWSPEDRWLTLTVADRDSGYDIWLIGSSGEAEPLLHGPFNESYAAFSPDGRWLAYTSDESGVTELYVQRFPLSGRKWQISADGGESPRWSPGGDAIYYWKGSRLMTVDVATEPGFKPGPERELPQPRFAQLGGWDIAPDGQRFVVVGRLESSGDPGSESQVHVPEIRIVLNSLMAARADE